MSLVETPHTCNHRKKVSHRFHLLHVVLLEKSSGVCETAGTASETCCCCGQCKKFGRLKLVLEVVPLFMTLLVLIHKQSSPESGDAVVAVVGLNMKMTLNFLISDKVHADR